MNLIYQQWAGTPRASAHAGVAEMRAYAARIGAEHQFVMNPAPVHQVGPGSKFYDKFLPLFRGTHDEFETVMFADTDLFPLEGMSVDIFAGFQAEVGLCTEPLQPDLRALASRRICRVEDEKWAAMVLKEWGGRMPRREDGALKVYNAGLMLWDMVGMLHARTMFPSPTVYVETCRRYGLYDFYGHDQNYMHAMIFSLGMNVVELDNEWNRLVHYQTRDGKIIRTIDPRTPFTRMVHIQLRGADDYDAQTLHRIANLPQSEWKLP